MAVYALLEVLALRGWESSRLLPSTASAWSQSARYWRCSIIREQLSETKSGGLAVGLIAVTLLNQ